MQRRRGSRWGLFGSALGVAALLATSACTVDVPTDDGNNDGGGGDGTSMLLAADNGSPTFDRNFNPYSPGKRQTSTLIYEPLFVTNTLDGTETPFLASAKEQPDPATVVFTIREDVVWTDGEEFTPEDVTFTFDLLKEFPALDTNGVWALIDSIEVDGQDVIVHLTGDNVPAAAIIQKTIIVPEHLWADVEDPTTYTNEDPVGTGPYMLGEFTPNEYTLDRNEDYWQVENVAAEELILPASNTQLDIVNNGYDWAYSFMSDVENTWVSAAEGNTFWFPPGGTIAMFPNLTMAPFDNPEFRLGLSAALDRDRIADVAEEGYVEAAGMSGLLLPNQEAWLNPDLPDGGAVSQDVDAALTHFEAAGYTMSGDQLVDSAGTAVALTLTTPNGWTDWLRGATEVQSQLAEVGITVTLNQPQPAAYQQELQNGNFQLSMGSFGGTGSIYEDFNRLLSSEFLQPVGTTTTANFQRYSDPETDALLAELRVTLDEGRQMEIAHELQTVVFEQAPVIPMFYGGLWGLFSEANFTGWPSADDPYASPATWDANPLLVLTNVEVAD
ncbi:ABC transporter substrate-binding protein [Occultella glacieicola]|uniref:ABC transporter substrate-binding protein n=2 Tax=Occultella glacieicola TaxID=2518684 RepID=A0ABY2EAT5_9MICO|nr:ABC transporter substrate-binding protein [Occultella glacieicola]